MPWLTSDKTAQMRRMLRAIETKAKAQGVSPIRVLAGYTGMTVSTCHRLLAGNYVSGTDYSYAKVKDAFDWIVWVDRIDYSDKMLTRWECY